MVDVADANPAYCIGNELRNVSTRCRPETNASAAGGQVIIRVSWSCSCVDYFPGVITIIRLYRTWDLQRRSTILRT